MLKIPTNKILREVRQYKANAVRLFGLSQELHKKAEFVLSVEELTELMQKEIDLINEAICEVQKAIDLEKAY